MFQPNAALATDATAIEVNVDMPKKLITGTRTAKVVKPAAAAMAVVRAPPDSG